MPTFSIVDGNSTSFTDTTPSTGLVIDFARLDNSFNVQVNGVDLFVGGPAGAPNELEFQTPSTSGQTVRFADGDVYGTNTQEIWQLSNTTDAPIVRLEINPDGTIQLFGVKVTDGPLEPLELFNGLTVNTAAIAAAWNDAGPNTVVVDQGVTGPTNASGEIEDVPCFTSGTVIETLRGPVRVENLCVLDQVLTYDNGYQPIRWIGSCRLSAAQVRKTPKLAPILIRAGALGPGYPKTDLTVSPQHRMLVSSVVAMRMFEAQDILIPAKKLLGLAGIEVVPEPAQDVVYWHFLFDAHQIVWSNGMPSESLYLGPVALNAISPEARSEIEVLFPEICAPDFVPQPVRHIPPKGKRIEKLVQRHRDNDKPIYNAHSAAGARQAQAVV